jgi:hypothetical protein
LEDEIYALSSVRFCNLNVLNDLSWSKYQKVEQIKSVGKERRYE